MQLDMLPPDLAGQVRELQEYEFTSSEAREQFEELLDQLRQQLMQSYVNQMAGAMSNVSPEQMQRMKDMLAELNQMLEQRERGEEPDFDGFMERYGDFFPENPQNLDELLEVMAQRMAAMQAMLNSMTPEQRAQLQGLCRAAARGHGPALAGRPARPEPASAVPRRWGGTGSYDFSGQDPLGFAEAAAMLAASWATSTSSRTCCGGPPTPARWPRSTSTGPASCSATTPADSLERMAELAKMLEEAGLIENKEGRFELTPRGIRRIGQNALTDLFKKLADDKIGQPRARALGRRPRARRTTPSPTSSATRSTSTSSARSATPSAAPAAARPVRLLPEDFEVERTEQRRALEHGADARPVAVDADARQLPAGQEGRHGAALADLVAVPARLPGHRRVQRGGPRAEGRAAARGLVGLRLRHQHAARLPAQPPPARPPDGHQADHHDHRRRADRPHHAVRATCSSTTRPCARRSTPRCARWPAARATASASTRSCSMPHRTCRNFVERLTELNRGRAFFTTPETLGDYVLVDFIEQRRSLLRGRRAG